jgi:hypothetical protein
MKLPRGFTIYARELMSDPNVEGLAVVSSERIAMWSHYWLRNNNGLLFLYRSRKAKIGGEFLNRDPRS